MPSQVMRLEDAGYSPATAYDFNLAVMTLAGTIEARQQETDRVQEPDGAKASKGHHWTQKPRYTLRQLLYDDPLAVDPADDDGPVSDALAHLPAAVL